MGRPRGTEHRTLNGDRLTQEVLRHKPCSGAVLAFRGRSPIGKNWLFAGSDPGGSGPQPFDR